MQSLEIVGLWWLAVGPAIQSIHLMAVGLALLRSKYLCSLFRPQLRLDPYKTLNQTRINGRNGSLGYWLS